MLNKFLGLTIICTILSIGFLCSTGCCDFEPKVGIGVITNSTLDGLSIKILPLPQLALQLGGYYYYREGNLYHEWGPEGPSEGSEILELDKDWETGARVFWRAHNFELGKIWKVNVYIDSYVGLGYVRSVNYERNRQYICEKDKSSPEFLEDECNYEIRVNRDSKLNIVELPLVMELRISWFSVNLEIGIFYETTKHEVRDTIERELNYEIGIGTHYYF